MAKGPQIMAHRGACGYAPENTIPSFKLAIEQGADGVELDIQLTKDGEIVVIHDETIDRTSNGKGWVKDYTFAELRQFNFNKTHPEYEHADIPTMREVFELIKPTNMWINIEIKTGIIFYPHIEEMILALTKEMGMEDRVYYSSFNHESVMKIKTLNPDAKVGFLYEDGTLEMPDYAIRHGVPALHPALYNLQYQGFVQECKEKGIILRVWTVNEEEHIRLCTQLGIDAIFTNYPDKARKIIESM